MTITLIPYGLLPNGNYGISLDPSTKAPQAAAIEILSALPSVADTSNFSGRTVFDTSQSSLYQYTTSPSAQWVPLEGIPATVGAVAGVPPTSPTPQDGSLYWDTTTEVLFVWDGTAWQAAGGRYAAQFIENTYLGDGVTTSFATGSATSISSEYIEIFLDGVRQYPTADYSVVGTLINFTVAPPNGVNIYVRALVSDAIVQTAQISTGTYTAVAAQTDFDLGLSNTDPNGAFVFVNSAIQQGSGIDYTIVQQDTSIVSLVKSALTTALVTTTASHNIPIGATVTLSGFSEAAYNNQSFTVTATPSTTSFEFTVALTDPSSGTPNPTAFFSPAFVNDTVQFTSAMAGGEQVDVRSFRSVVTSTNVGETNTLASVGTGTSLASTKIGTTLQLKSLAAGGNITLTDLGNEIQVDANVGQAYEDRVGINTTVYSVSGNESYVGVRSTTSAVTINLNTIAQIPANSGRRITIKDESGGAGTNAISIVTSPSLVDGSAGPYTINANYGSVTMVFDGTDWYITTVTP